jgi:hypothetical protein
MKHVTIAVIFAIAAAWAAFAEAPAPKPEPGAAHPPTGRVEQAVPPMKALDAKQQPPTGRVGDVVPPMKSTDKPSLGAGTTTTGATLAAAPSQEWIGRSIFSSDGKELGKVSSVEDSAIFADLGGFLGLGATRTRISSDKIQSVTEDRIMLSLSEGEAKNLPAADAAQPDEPKARMPMRREQPIVPDPSAKPESEGAPTE